MVDTPPSSDVRIPQRPRSHRPPARQPHLPAARPRGSEEPGRTGARRIGQSADLDRRRSGGARRTGLLPQVRRHGGGFRQRSGAIKALLRGDDVRSSWSPHRPPCRSTTPRTSSPGCAADPEFVVANRCTADPGEPIGDADADAARPVAVAASRRTAGALDRAEAIGLPADRPQLAEPVTSLDGVLELAERLDPEWDGPNS